MVLPATEIRESVEKTCRKLEANENNVHASLYCGINVPSLTLAEMDRFLEAWRRKSSAGGLTLCNCFGDYRDELNHLEASVGRFLAGVFSHAQPSLKCIFLYDNLLSLEELDMIGVASFGAKFPLLADINLEGNDFGDQGISLLADGLLHLPSTMRSLRIAFEAGLTRAGCRAFAAAVSQSSLRRFVVVYCEAIGNEGVIEIADCLGSHDELGHLELDSVACGPIGCGAIASSVRTMKSLRHLDLVNNFVGDAGAVSIAEVLPMCDKLRYLGLDNNGIGDIGCKAIASALCKSKIRTLYMNENDIGDEGAEALARALAANKPDGLCHLGVSGNSIRVQGGLALARAARFSSTILHINLYGNPVPERVADEFICALHANHNLSVYLRQTTQVSEYHVQRILGLSDMNKCLSDRYEKNLKDKDIGQTAVPLALEVFKDKPGLLFDAVKSTMPAWLGLAGE